MATCVVCGVEVEGYSSVARNVKCGGCRKTPPRRQKVEGTVEGKVKCVICGVARKRLQHHIRSRHEMTTGEYQDKYPGSPVEMPREKHSSQTRRKMARAASQRWEDEEERQAQSERLKESAPWKGKELSEEHREGISRGGLGVPHTLSPEEIEKRTQRVQNAYLRKLRDPSFHRKLSRLRRERIQSLQEKGVPFGFQDPETWQKGYDTRLRNGTLNPPNAGRGITGFRKGIPHYCRSTLEANFARILLLAGVSYEYEPKTVRIAPRKTYTPDFYLHSSLEGIPSGWVELKGWRYKDGSLPDGVEEKVSAFEEEVGEEIFVLTQHDPLWLHLKSTYAPQIPLWETPGRNLKTHPDLFGEGKR